jgi:diadenosine tetraphosphate (Ap4A) HIT family hydrolase
MESDRCLFCERIAGGELTASSALAAAFPDAYPLRPGHTLVVPRRHEPDFFALSPDELKDVMAVAVDLHRRLSEELGIDGMNLGVNAGVSAGQTIAHAHLHLIPRYENDVPDPAGGIRWMFPDRARYWEETAPEPRL